MTRDGATYVYLSDAHMDVRALADTEGNIVNRYRYDAWGNTLYAEETVENTYRYCQEAYDGESGNTYLRARYYSATTANFLSADAYAGSIENPMTLNKYAYAGANPVMYADPSGYAFTTFELSIRAAMESILIHMPQINLIGVLSGGLAAIDTALSGEGDVVESFFIGYGVGIAGASLICGVMAIPAIMLEVKMMLAVVQSVSIGFGIQLAGAAWEEGNVPLAVFRSIMVTADIATFYMQFGPEIANGWRYYFGNTGGRSTASAAARVTSGHESGSNLGKMDLDDLPQNVKEAFRKYDNAGWQGNVSGQTQGTNAGRKWGNRDGQLPTVDMDGNSITYREFDVNNYNGVSRDGERFIVGSDGSVWYTDSHYGQGESLNGINDFVQIK